MAGIKLEKVILCSNCNRQVESSRGVRFLLTSKIDLGERKISYAEGIELFASMTNKRITIEPTDAVKGDSRYLCRECGNNFSTGLKSMSKFFNRQSAEAYVASKLLVDEPKTPMRLPPVPHKDTPVGARVKNMMRNVNNREIVSNNFIHVLRDELEVLKEKSSLRVSQINEKNWLPSAERLRMDMEEHSPLLLKILETFLHKKTDRDQFGDRIRAMLGIILFSQSQKTSLFQKNVGMILFLSKASIKMSKKIFCFTYA
jgi:hypothetical protein